MQTPIEISVQGTNEDARVRATITEHIARLEQRYGRITAARVAVKGTGHPQGGGAPYEVRIRLALPNGREVNIARTASKDERNLDLTFSINDAFKRARRRLQDHARQLQGAVKQHNPSPVGIVARIDPSGEFGFLHTNDGQEIYFHRNSVLNNGFSKLTIGARVTFAEEIGEKGPQASSLKLLGRHSLRA